MSPVVALPGRFVEPFDSRAAGIWVLEPRDASLDALWAKEAEERLAAYRRGKIRTAAWSDVIAKYQANT